jgi:hypothetical protein
MSSRRKSRLASQARRRHAPSRPDRARACHLLPNPTLLGWIGAGSGDLLSGRRFTRQSKVVHNTKISLRTQIHISQAHYGPFVATAPGALAPGLLAWRSTIERDVQDCHSSLTCLADPRGQPPWATAYYVGLHYATRFPGPLLAADLALVVGEEFCRDLSPRSVHESPRKTRPDVSRGRQPLEESRSTATGVTDNRCGRTAGLPILRVPLP